MKRPRNLRLGILGLVLTVASLPGQTLALIASDAQDGGFVPVDGLVPAQRGVVLDQGRMPKAMRGVFVFHPEGPNLRLHASLDLGKGSHPLADGGASDEVEAFLAVSSNEKDPRLRTPLGSAFFGPGPRLLLAGQLVEFELPGFQHWELRHLCAARLEVVARDEDGAAITSCVFAPGVASVQIALHVPAGRSGDTAIVLSSCGERWRLGEREVSMGTGSELRCEDAAWWRGVLPVAPAEESRFDFRGVAGWRLRAPSGRGLGPRSLQALPEHRVRIGVAPSGAGAFFRAQLSLGAGSLAGPAPLVLPPGKRRLSVVGGDLPACGVLKPWNPALEPGLRRLLRDPRFGLARRGIDAGDYQLARGVWANLEFDLALGLINLAHANADPAAWRAARAAVDHLLSQDLDATRGLFNVHGAGHCGGPPEVGHHWIEGLLVLRALSGDPLLDAAWSRLWPLQQASFEALKLETQLPRSLGWGLLALGRTLEERRNARDRIGARRVEKELRRWRSFLLSRQRPCGLLALARSRGPSLEIPAIQGGVLLPALKLSLRLLPNARDRLAVDRLAKALARIPVRGAEGLVLPEGILVPMRGRRPGPGRGEADPPWVALFLAGLRSERKARASPGLRGLREALAEGEVVPRRGYPGSACALLLRSLPRIR